MEHLGDILLSAFICCHTLVVSFWTFSAFSSKSPVLGQPRPYLVWIILKERETYFLKFMISATKGHQFWDIVKLKLFVFFCAYSRQTKKIHMYIVVTGIMSKEVLTKIVKYIVTSWSELSCDVNAVGFIDYKMKMHWCFKILFFSTPGHLAKKKKNWVWLRYTCNNKGFIQILKFLTPLSRFW